MANNNIVPGDIILVKGNTWIARQIRKLMNLYLKKKGLKTREVYSHAAIVIEVWGELYVAEAGPKGVQILPLDFTYRRILDKVKIKTPRKPYTKREKEYISKNVIRTVFSPTRYDYFGLLHQIEYILTGTWDGKIGSKAKKKLYCTEAVAGWVNSVRPNTFDNEASINPVDIDINKYYTNKLI